MSADGTASEAEIETDAGPRDRKAGPERLCVATRTVKPVAELIRFVVGPDQNVIPDIKGKLPGRGVWVTGTREAVAQAAARNAFARGFRRPVGVSSDLAAETGRLLERSAVDALAIAHKAGLVEAGFTKTETALRDGRAIALLQASEAAADGARKLAAAARHGRDEGSESTPLIAFAGPQLDLALGRSNVIHAALLAGPASETLLARCRRLERFRGGEPGKPAGKGG